MYKKVALVALAAGAGLAAAFNRLPGLALGAREKAPAVARFGGCPLGACGTGTRRGGFSHGVFQWGGGIPPGINSSGPLRRPATR